MPTNLVPDTEIPALASKVTPPMLDLLRRIRREGYIRNGHQVDAATLQGLGDLAKLDLVDAGYEAGVTDRPYVWMKNWNGSRVLGYKTGIWVNPHYELPAGELAAWLEDQGKNRWWNVDGDPLLTGRMTFPCPAGRLAGELRRIGQVLLVQAKRDDAGAKGQSINKDKLNEIVGTFAEDIHVFDGGRMPPWGGDRTLYLCWKDKLNEWLLSEDSEATEQAEADETANAGQE